LFFGLFKDGLNLWYTNPDINICLAVITLIGLMAPILVSCILCVMLICSRNRKFKNKVEISPILAPIKFPNDVQDHEALNNLDTSNPAQLENSYPPKKPPDTLSTPQAYKPTETFKHSETSYPLEI